MTQTNTNTIHISNVNSPLEDTQGHRCKLLSPTPVLTGEEKQQQQKQLDEDYSQPRKKKSRGNRKEQHRRRRQRQRQQKLNNVISENADHTTGSLLIVTDTAENDFNDGEYVRV